MLWLLEAIGVAGSRPRPCLHGLQSQAPVPAGLPHPPAPLVRDAVMASDTPSRFRTIFPPKDMELKCLSNSFCHMRQHCPGPGLARGQFGASLSLPHLRKAGSSRGRRHVLEDEPESRFSKVPGCCTSLRWGAWQARIPAGSVGPEGPDRRPTARDSGPMSHIKDNGSSGPRSPFGVLCAQVGVG